MSSGGARATSGPPPDPDALRRDRDVGTWKTLPIEGRQGPAPEWPLSKATKREADLWAREWTRPQAVMWERNGQEVEVAMYVRSLAAAEKRDAPVNARTLVRQQQEALGLSLPGLARNHWRIGKASSDASSSRKTPEGKRAKDRFKVLAGGAA
jgi:hypothetical protein